jgi:YcxB-like protein
MTGTANELHRPTEGDAPSVEFQYVERDFIAAAQLYATPTRKRRIFILLLVLVVAAVTFMYFRQVHQTIVIVAMMLVGGKLGGFVELYAYLPWKIRCNLARSPLSHVEHKLTLRPEGISVQSPRGENALQWNDFLRWRTNEKTTLIFLSPVQYLHFPARLAELGFPIDRLKVELARELGPPF